MNMQDPKPVKIQNVGLKVPKAPKTSEQMKNFIRKKPKQALDKEMVSVVVTAPGYDGKKVHQEGAKLRVPRHLFSKNWMQVFGSEEYIAKEEVILGVRQPDSNHEDQDAV